MALITRKEVPSGTNRCGSRRAPSCFILCRVTNPEASSEDFEWDARDEANTLLIQTDWDFPGVARSFGWSGEDDEIAQAAEFLSRVAREEKVVEDPGYFDER